MWGIRETLRSSVSHLSGGKLARSRTPCGAQVGSRESHSAPGGLQSRRKDGGKSRARNGEKRKRKLTPPNAARSGPGPGPSRLAHVPAQAGGRPEDAGSRDRRGSRTCRHRQADRPRTRGPRSRLAHEPAQAGGRPEDAGPPVEARARAGTGRRTAGGRGAPGRGSRTCRHRQADGPRTRGPGPASAPSPTSSLHIGDAPPRAGRAAAAFPACLPGAPSGAAAAPTSPRGPEPAGVRGPQQAARAAVAPAAGPEASRCGRCPPSGGPRALPFGLSRVRRAPPRGRRCPAGSLRKGESPRLAPDRPVRGPHTGLPASPVRPLASSFRAPGPRECGRAATAAATGGADTGRKLCGPRGSPRRTRLRWGGRPLGSSRRRPARLGLGPSPSTFRFRLKPRTAAAPRAQPRAQEGHGRRGRGKKERDEPPASPAPRAPPRPARPAPARPGSGLEPSTSASAHRVTSGNAPGRRRGSSGAGPHSAVVRGRGAGPWCGAVVRWTERPRLAEPVRRRPPRTPTVQPGRLRSRSPFAPGELSPRPVRKTPPVLVRTAPRTSHRPRQTRASASRVGNHPDAPARASVPASRRPRP
ncbi:basic salivary proline-rich protein 1-like [Mustela putorius furo]|uniref:Basic salivary proline-rich protein 1-like n=1 Tax=Mustela putorius furo TaxID=9669 RepID=A0A8U0S2T7_MUSPF|nr:basic salivary proline-rich protein 1-like [Mustela putorius furo]